MIYKYNHNFEPILPFVNASSSFDFFWEGCVSIHSLNPVGQTHPSKMFQHSNSNPSTSPNRGADVLQLLPTSVVLLGVSAKVPEMQTKQTSWIQVTLSTPPRLEKVLATAGSRSWRPSSRSWRPNSRSWRPSSRSWRPSSRSWRLSQISWRLSLRSWTTSSGSCTTETMSRTPNSRNQKKTGGAR